MNEPRPVAREPARERFHFATRQPGARAWLVAVTFLGPPNPSEECVS